MANKAIKFNAAHEKIILGTMIRDDKQRSKLAKTLPASAFYSSKHRAIFSALKEVDERGLECIPPTVKTFLPDDESTWGGTDYLESLSGQSSEGNLAYHLQQMMWDTSRNSIYVEKLGEFEVALKDPNIEPEEVMQLLDGMRNRIIESKVGSAYLQGKGLAAQYQARMYARSNGVTLRTSGYTAFDRLLTRPFAPGLITVLAAAPSIGKTTFSLNMAARQAKKWKVGYLAWESGTNAAIDIMCSSQLKIPLETIIKYPDKLTEYQEEQIEEYVETVFSDSGNLSFLDRPPKSVVNTANQWEVNNNVLDWFEAQLDGWDRDIVYWDLFEKRLPDRRPQAISWALDRAQEIAQEHKVHLVLLHQITFKQVEAKKDKRPTRDVLKGSGGYIEVPDFVFALYRDAVYKGNVEDTSLDLFCLKQRQGIFPFQLTFDWEGQYCRVSNARKVQMTVVEDEYNDDV